MQTYTDTGDSALSMGCSAFPAEDMMSRRMVRARSWVLLLTGTLLGCGADGLPSGSGIFPGHVGSIVQPLSFPSISGLSPTYGSPRGGYVLTITGSNFVGTSCDLDFGGTHAVVKPTSTTQIDLTVPNLLAGSRPQKIVIQVSCSGLLSKNSVEFWYIEDRVPLLPPLTARGTAGQRDLGIADLDGDGEKDIIVANPSRDGLVLYRGLGKGKFAEVIDPALATTLKVPNGPYAIALGDLDKDGKIDIAVTQLRASNVTIFWNNTTTAGAWSFATDTRSIGAAATLDPKAIEIADLDGDKWDDLTVAHPATNSLSFLAVTAGRTVAPWFLIKPPAPPPPSWAVESLVAADLNNDGAKELITLSEGGKTLTIIPDILRFTSPWQWKSFAAEYGSMAVSDLDLDGRQEIVLGAKADSHVLTLQVDREGGINGIVPKRFSTSGVVQSLSIADVNGDTLPDVLAGLTAAADHSIDVLFADSGSLLKSAQSVELGSRGGILRVTDMDSDGLPDAVLLDLQIPILSDGSNLLTVRKNLGRSFEPLWLLDTGGPQPAVLTHFDANGDGVPDLAVADTSAKTLRTLQGNGLGAFHPVAPPTPLTGLPGCLAAGDYNGDFRDDVVVCRSEPASRGIDLWSTALDGTFKRIRSIPTTALPLALARDESLIGLDGNAFPDFVVGGSGVSASLVTLVGQPPLMADFTRKTYTVGRAISSLVMASFSSPDNDVLAAAPLDGAIYLLAGNGTGGLGGASKVAAVTEPDVLVAADFVPDGKLDFVVLSSSQGKLATFLGDGAGRFTLAPNSEIAFGMMSAPSALAVGDFNRDTVPDLAVRLDGSQRIKLLLGLGDGRFIVSPTEILPDSSGAMDVTDVDGDTRPDLVFSVNKSSEHSAGWVISLTGSP